MEQYFNAETPTKRTMAEERMISTPNKLFPRYLLLSNNSSLSPLITHPSPRRTAVRNPFENQLHERLHLPVISDSPSLFQTILTPKQQFFEWTIDELSSLNPVNLVPCETQFREELDPIREAQAQDAINSYFKEQKIVPSPIDCSLRNQRIIFKNEINSQKIVNSTANACSKAYKLTMPQKRDIASQTALTFPPELPKEVEDLLKKYHLIDDGDETQTCEAEAIDTSQSNTSMMESNEFMNFSTLRRQLFIRTATPCEGETPEQSISLSPPPLTPELTKSICEDHEGESRKSIDSFGDRDNFEWHLSPIQPFSPGNVSMLSESGHGKTPSRGQGSKKLMKKGKNLHSSFCLMQSEDLQGEEILPEIAPKGRFGRFDSGFPADDEESKLSAEYMSDFNMQF